MMWLSVPERERGRTHDSSFSLGLGQPRIHVIGYQTALSASEQLCPPNPKLFDRTLRTRASRDWFGT